MKCSRKRIECDQYKSHLKRIVIELKDNNNYAMISTLKHFINNQNSKFFLDIFNDVFEC